MSQIPFLQFFFMGMSLVAGLAMIVFTLYFRKHFRRFEIVCKYILGGLLLYSVVIRYLILLPGKFPLLREVSIIFDVFYVALCVAVNYGILKRGREGTTDRRRRDDSKQ